MQKHTKIYLDALGYDESDFIPSEISNEKAVDIHHIIGRGKKGEDRIENLMALTRIEHEEFGDKKVFMPLLFRIHRSFLRNKGVKFDNDYFEKMISKYEN